MSDKELIQICLEEISQKLGYSDPKSLRQRDLEHLCREIEKRTNILISLSTIKRLLNGQFNRLPQIATLNAITTYLGYESWQDFKIKKQGVLRVNPEPESVEVQPTIAKGRRWISYKVIVLGIVAILCIMMVSLNYFKKGSTVKEGDISFSVKKVTSSDIPNTVVFSYDLDKASGDSFFIQQSWDRDRRVKIDKNSHTLTDIYYEPGYHNAKLIINDKVVKTIDVFIPTDGWLFYSKPYMFRGLPSYIRSANPVNNGVLAFTEEDVVNSKIDPRRENFYNYTLFPPTYDVPSDNFSFKTRIRIKEINSLVCPRIMHEVFGQSNSMFFFTTLPGCTGSIDVRFGEHLLHGKTSDLSAFGCDVREWQDVDLIVKDKVATVFINKKEVFSKRYSESFGMITGMAFMSNGLCEIDNVELKSLDGKIIYKDGFDK